MAFYLHVQLPSKELTHLELWNVLLFNNFAGKGGKCMPVASICR